MGSQVVMELVRRGERPIVYDIRPQTRFIEEAKDKVKIVRGDVTDLNHLLETIKNEQVDRIIHTAYYQSPGFKSVTTGTIDENPVLAFKINLDGTFNIFETARLLDVKKVIFFST